MSARWDTGGVGARVASGRSVQLSRCQRPRPSGAATLPPTGAAPRDGGDRVAGPSALLGLPHAYPAPHNRLP